jgi:A/G-specific adenine glycosylase
MLTRSRPALAGAASSTTRPALATAVAAPRRTRHTLPSPRADPTNGGGGGAPAGLSEDVLARLRAAEQEAARLREELAQVQQQQQQQQQGGEASSSATAAAADGASSADKAASSSSTPPLRIDSTDSRELPWTAGKRTAWLSEADVTFFTGAGITEGNVLGDGAGAASSSPEQQGVVRRRLLQGALATAALAAFALVPTRALRIGAPSKPLFFYLVPLVRALDQLRDLEPAVEDADWPRLRAARALIVGPPGNARDNLYDAVAALDSYAGESTVAKGTAKRAEALAGEVVEALDALDYNKYFDAAMMGAAPSGSQNAEFVKFTREARRAAERSLNEFLALMPREAVEGAKQVVEQQREAMAGM